MPSSSLRLSWLFFLSIIVLGAGCQKPVPVVASTEKETPPADSADAPVDLTTDALLAAHVRGAELWKNQVVSDLVSGIMKGSPGDMDVDKFAKSELGMSPEDLDTVFFYLEELPLPARRAVQPAQGEGGPTPKDVKVIFFTHEDLDALSPKFIAIVTAKDWLKKDSVLPSMRIEGRSKPGFIFLKQGYLLHFPDAQTFAVLHISLADRYAKDKQGWPASEALAKASKGHTLAALVNPGKFSAAARADATGTPFASLLTVKNATLTLDVKSKECNLAALARFDNAADANKSKESLAQVSTLALQALDELAARFRATDEVGAGFDSVFKEIKRALAETQVESGDDRVTVKGTLKLDFDVPKIVEEAVQKITDAADRKRLSNNFKQTVLGLLNYANTYQRIVLVSGTDAMRQPIKDLKSKPMLSWRVAILPFVGHPELYSQFKHNEPWDSAHNKKLIPLMPRIYAPVKGGKPGEGKTTIQMVVGPAAMRPGYEIDTIPDGTSNTVAIVEAAEPVIWTKPDDVFIPGKEMPKDLKKQFGGQFKGLLAVGMWDGSFRHLRMDSLTEKTLWDAIRPDDGNPLGDDWQR